jgi:peptide/nickel transport system permease protein
MTVPPGDVELLTERHDAVDVAEGSESGDIKGRSPWAIAWRRLRRDKVALTGGVVVILLILLALFARVIERALSLDPNTPHNNQFQKGGNVLDPTTLLPKGSLGGISWDHPLGVEPGGTGQGRDVLARIIEGAWVSLLVAVLATVLSVMIGVLLGVIAGYYGGWIDALVSRLMDIFLAFPLLLFAIAISAPLQSQHSAFGLSGVSLNIGILVFVIGFFNWPYMGRIIRGQALSLREREFVAAARSIGARGPYILFKELLPNLVAPIIVYSTLLIPTNILFEAALDFLAVGIKPPQASWGGMLSESVTYYRDDPTFMLIPGIAIFVTVLAFNLLGDGLRDALDPKSGR